MFLKGSRSGKGLARNDLAKIDGETFAEVVNQESFGAESELGRGQMQPRLGKRTEAAVGWLGPG